MSSTVAPDGPGIERFGPQKICCQQMVAHGLDEPDRAPGTYSWFQPGGDPMLLRGLIGTVLRRIRLSQGRTLRDVADAARVSVPYLSEVERGRKEPSSELLSAICVALELDLTELLAQVQFEIAAERLSRSPYGVPYGAPYGGRSRTDDGRTITSLTSVSPYPGGGSGVQLAVSVAA
jgi:transcriptional regulator with XRE-family HTH domain